MLVKKGGITRNIDEHRLQEYKDKGYVPAGSKREPSVKPDKK